MLGYAFIIILCVLLAGAGWALTMLAGAGPHGEDSLQQRLEQALPGIQCGQCGHPGCAAYAQAMSSGQAPINRCTPGGPDTIKALAALLGIDASAYEEDREDLIFRPRRVALIHRTPCTGCARCVRVCPMDCILGRIRYVHEVIQEECIGCEECTRVCPEKCIEMVTMEQSIRNFNWDIKAVRITGNAKSL